MKTLSGKKAAVMAAVAFLFLICGSVKAQTVCVPVPPPSNGYFVANVSSNKVIFNYDIVDASCVSLASSTGIFLNAGTNYLIPNSDFPPGYDDIIITITDINGNPVSTSNAVNGGSCSPAATSATPTAGGFSCTMNWFCSKTNIL